MTRLLVEKEGTVWVVQFHNPPHSYMDNLTAQELVWLWSVCREMFLIAPGKWLRRLSDTLRRLAPISSN